MSEWDTDETIGERAEAFDELLAKALGTPPESDWRQELAALPEEAKLSELLQFLGMQREDEQAIIVASIRDRLGEDATDPSGRELVRMMTMHSAKGLSATVVFIPGLEEEIIPSERRSPYPGLVLEAARMLYVSITRARSGFIVSYAKRRFINGQVRSRTPSRFANHLGGTFRPGSEGLTEEVARRVVKEWSHLSDG